MRPPGGISCQKRPRNQHHRRKKPVPKDELQCSVVGLTRFELVTSRLSVVRSDQLSYRPILRLKKPLFRAAF